LSIVRHAEWSGSSIRKNLIQFHALPALILAVHLTSPVTRAAGGPGKHASKPRTKNAKTLIQGDAIADAGEGSAAVQSRGPGQQAGWLGMVSRTQAEQPHWITPLVTVTPRLEQEFRFDISRPEKDGQVTSFYGGGKGVELIPAEKLEVIIGIPSYNVQNFTGGKAAFADEPLLVKYRIFASNEEHGNQILTFFLGASLPTGSPPFSAGHGIITPTIAYGKGYGRFDVQTTLGIGLPTGGTAKLGRAITWNAALQEHTARFLWPELEFNSTFWDGGVNGGKKQLFVTPGIVVGRIPLRNRLGLTAGIGLQVAATRFHTYNHAITFSFRLPF
jgi:hypothetical protein